VWSPTGGRVQSIDGLRGVAALLVVLFHLHEAISRSASGWLWAPFDWVARNGFLGVDIFFVISGYVIALSVNKGDASPSYFGRFIIRRSIRLDPPYWLAILLELALLHVTLRLFPAVTVSLPSTPQLLSHLVYAQELLGHGSVIPIFWTLCYEIQFYAFFVGLVVVQASLPSALRRPSLTALICAALFILSLWTRYWPPAGLPHGLAIDRWYQFFVGALTYRAVSAPGRLGALVAAWVAVAVAVVAAGAPVIQFLAIAVSVLLVVASRDLWVGRVLAARPLRYLGIISYSLYLYHSSVGWRFVSLVQQRVPGPWSAPLALGVYLVGILGTIAFSAALWWLIERPCIRLSQRIRLPLRAGTAAPIPPH